MEMAEDADRALRDTYKRIKVYYDPAELPYLVRDIRPSVSYDTVPKYIGYSAIEDMDGGFPGVEVTKHTVPVKTDLSRKGATLGSQVFLNPRFLLHNHVSGDDDYEIERMKKRIFDASPLANNPLSLTRSKKSVFNYTADGKIIRSDYPTKPVFVNKIIIRSRTNVHWDERWAQRKSKIEYNMEHKDEKFMYPDILFPEVKEKPLIMGDDFVPITKEQRRRNKILTIKQAHPTLPRTVVCYISGRRHTWAGLDWAVRSLAENDHLVIVATIPKMTSHRDQEPEVDGTWVSGYTFDEIDAIISDLFEYIKVIKPVHKALKVTIEISIERTKGALIDAINVYSPDFLILGTLKWQRYENLVSYRGNNMVDKLCTTFPIPIFIVPARRLFMLEKEIEEETLTKLISDNTKKAVTPENEEIEYPRSPKLVSTDSFGFWSKNEQKLLDESYSISTKDKLEKRQESFTSLTTHESEDSLAIEDDDDRDSNLLESTESIVSKLKSIAITNRKNMMADLEEFDNEHSNINTKENQLAKVSLIIKHSLNSSNTIKNLTQNLDEENRGFAVLQKVITGTGTVESRPKFSMVDAVRVNGKIPGESSAKKRRSQIKFASNVKPTDGTAGLGTPRIVGPTGESQYSGGTSPLRTVDSNESALTFASNGSKISKHGRSSSFGTHSVNNGFLSVKRNSMSDQVSFRSADHAPKLLTKRTSKSNDKSKDKKDSKKSSTKKKLGKLFSFGNL